MATISVWSFDDPALSAAPLAADGKFDVCVIGGGIAGLTTAYLLATEGKKVVVLEAQPGLADGETRHTTAHLAWVLDDRFARVASIRGDNVARAAADSHRSAIGLIEQIAAREQISCEFRRVVGYLFPGADGPDVVLDEADALRRLGITFSMIDDPPAPEVAGPSLRFAGQGQFHPRKYLAGLATAIRKHGGTIHTSTRAVRIEGGSPCTVRTEAGNTVTASAVVVATNAPFDAGVLLHTKLAAYTTYAVAMEVARGIVPEALYWDTEDPYHYIRIHPGPEETDYLIVGGEDHKTGQATDQDERLGAISQLDAREVPRGRGGSQPLVRTGIRDTRWPGPDWSRAVGPQCLRHHWRFGHGPHARDARRRLVANLIRGQADTLEQVYDPSRLMPVALKTFLAENLNLAAQYTDWLTGGDVKLADEIPPGQGAIVRRGLKKLAVYKEKDGKVCEMSAACPHLGAVVRWNPGEQSWDCPAHGSRFSCDGKVLHGPAVEGLKQAE